MQGVLQAPKPFLGAYLGCPVDFHGEKRFGRFVWLVELKGEASQKGQREPFPEKRRKKKGKKGRHWATGLTDFDIPDPVAEQKMLPIFFWKQNNVSLVMDSLWSLRGESKAA